MSDDGEVKAHAAKKLGVPVERVRLARLVDVGGGQPRHLIIVIDTDDKKTRQALAFSPDGKYLHVELVADAKDLTLHAVPTILDFDTTVNLNTARLAKQIDLTVEKDAKWVDVHGEIVRLQGNVTNAKNGEVLWAQIGDDRKAVTGKTFAVQGAAGGVHGLTFTTVDADDKSSNTFWAETQTLAIQLESDVDFLKRVIKDVRGGTPTALEEKYFAEDKDPKKREKLLDALLKDPAVAKKVGDDWKKKMLATSQTQEGTYRYSVTPKFIESAQGGGLRSVIPQFQPSDPKKGGGTYKLQVVPAVDPKSGKLELKWQPDPKGNVPLNLVFPTEQKQGGTTKEGFREWRVFPSTNPNEPNDPAIPNPPNPPQPPKVRTTKVVPPTPVTPVTPTVRVLPRAPVTPNTPATPVTPATPATPRAGNIDRIVDALLAAKKSDADILDGITLVVLGRLPTEAEKKLTLGLIAQSADRKAAWLGVAKALAATGEGRQRSDATGRLRLETKDVDVEAIEVTGTVETTGDRVRLRVNPPVDPELHLELKPRTNPEVKPLPPAKK